MEIVIYIIVLLILTRYAFVLAKYIKTGKFKKNKRGGHLVGIIAYSFLTVLLICILISAILVNKDKPIDLFAWIMFASGFGTFIMYPIYWQQKIYENAKAKNIEISKQMNEEFFNKYGSEEYDEFKVEHFNISDDLTIDNYFNALISLITNDEISFIHPNEYKNIADVFSSLYQQDYIKLLCGSESVGLTCENINALLKKYNFDFNLNSADITKNDDEFIKARRRDYIPTMAYDLNKINETIKSKLKDYELVAFLIYNKEGKGNYPTYLCIINSSRYSELFNVSDNEMEETNNE